MGEVVIANAKKLFGDIEILHGINLNISEGSFTVLVGPSGCGKTTLLRMIAGLEQISSGEIQINGKIVNNLPPKERDIAMVFQNYALYPHMRVFDNMAFSLKLAKIDKAEIKKRVESAAKILNLTDYLDRYPRQLSGGQRQRVAMGPGRMRKPQVFLFDEPLSNLDAKLRVQMRTEIKELHQRLKTTSVYVTHDQVEAMTMADQIVVMRAGFVEQIGEPLDIYDHPNNVFTASFIGSPSMNFLHGSVIASGFKCSNNMILPLPDKLANRVGDSLIYGIRPEHISLTEQGAPPFAEVQVKIVEPTGADTMILTDFRDIEICILIKERVVIKPGDRLHLHAKPENWHYFDGKTEQAIKN